MCKRLKKEFVNKNQYKSHFNRVLYEPLIINIKSKELNRDNAFVYRNLALIFKFKGDKAKSCLNYQKALDLNIIQNWGEKYVEELIECCK